MWITHVGGKFRHGLLEESLISVRLRKRKKVPGILHFLVSVRLAVVARACPTCALRKQMRKKIWENLCCLSIAKAKARNILRLSASSKPTTEFKQPHLSRVERQSSPARGYKFGCVCSYMAGHEDAGVMTGHIGTNTPKFVPPRWGRLPFDPIQTGLCKFGRGFGAR